jgi:hypothetical protein
MSQYQCIQTSIHALKIMSFHSSLGTEIRAFETGFGLMVSMTPGPTSHEEGKCRGQAFGLFCFDGLGTGSA